jgi:NADH-quinone oxidoreductase subunit I
MSASHSHDAHSHDDHGHGHDAQGSGVDGAPRQRVNVVVVPRPGSFSQQAYLPAIVKGLGITMRHFFENLFGGKHIITVQYPEERVAYPARYRGVHRLMRRDDGEVRCVACMCCPTVCPAHCITIVAEETGNGNEKRPKVFEIDELRCIACGLCVEACPCDAIRMDTATHMPPTEHRYDAILGKNDLLSRGERSTATQGGLGADWRLKQPVTARE